MIAAHEAAMAAGQPTYRDPITGYQVETAEHIWRTRACCDLGCRHCPYGR
ncbi:MAG: DUF5522 domain-containing protein [Planctomycetota bacterium]